MSHCAIQSEWLHWFDRLDADETIRRAAYRPAIPVEGLASMHVEDACGKLEAGWSEIFVPGPQHVQILRMLVSQARNFSRSMYPTLKDYNRQRCGEVVAASEVHSIRCLTGLAGVSKSSLMKAFERICQVTPANQFVAEGQRLTLFPLRRVPIQAHLSVRTVLKSLANPVAVAGRSMPDINVLLTHVRDWLLATGTAALLVDEMQFFTQSSKASTRTSQLILTLASLGFPLVYVANYSLVNKLMQRPHEEKDRLLAYPIVLEPPAADSAWWMDVLKEYLSVSPQHFCLDVQAHAQELHRLTGGLFRALRQLLLEAYRVAVERGSPFVTMGEVRLAYRTAQFSSHRKDVEDLTSLAMSSLIAERRPDLVCPFVPVKNIPLRAVSVPSVVSPVTPIDPPSALLESAISAGAQATLEDLRRVANQSGKHPGHSNVTRMSRRTPVSAQSLLEGAQLLRSTLAKSPSSSKSKSLTSSDEQAEQHAGTSSVP